MGYLRKNHGPRTLGRIRGGPYSSNSINPNSILYAAAWAANVTANGGTYSGAALTAVQALDADLGLAQLKGKLVYLNPRCGNNIIAASVPLIAKFGPGLDTRSGTFAVWNEGRGFSGTTGIADTGVNPVAAGLQSAAVSLGVYMIEDASTENETLYGNGIQGGATFALAAAAFGHYTLFDAFNGSAGRVQTNDSVISDGTATKGLIVGTRWQSAHAAVFRNTIQRGFNSSEGGTLTSPTVKFYTQRGLSGGDFIGSGLTPDDVANLTWILHEFNAAFLRSVSAEGLVGYDRTPDQFTFTDITGAAPSTLYTSNTITVTGIDHAADMSIVGGTYSKNGGGYTSAPTTVVLNDTVSVRQTSSAVEFDQTDVVLTIGVVSDTYSVTTTGTSAAITWATSGQGFSVVTEGVQHRLITRSNTSGIWRGGRSAESQSTGKRYVEVYVNQFGNPAKGEFVGLDNGVDSLDSPTLGGTNNGISYSGRDGKVQQNGVTLDTLATFMTGDTIGILVDFTLSTVKFNKNNGSFSSAYDITLLGTPLKVGITLSDTPTPRYTLSKPLLYSLPSGSTDWSA